MEEGESNEVLCCSTIDHNQCVMKGLQEQLIEGRNCDLEIRLRDNQLYVHKCLVDIFFSKIGVDIENDMFYLDLKEFPQTMVAPLIDMMYHGILSVPRDNMHDVEKFANYVGYKQAQELIAQYQQTAAQSHVQPTVKPLPKLTNKTLQEPVEVNGFVIKSEPPEDEEEFNVEGYVADVIGKGLPKPQGKPVKRGDHSDCVYEVFMPNPAVKDAIVSKGTKSWNLNEDSSIIDMLIRDKDKAQVTVTDRPYHTVSQIRKLNERIFPRGNESTLNSSGLGVGTVSNSPKSLKHNSPKRLKHPLSTETLLGLHKKLAKNIAKRSVDVSIRHVASPNPASKPKGDTCNTTNFKQAAANRLMQKNMLNSIASTKLKTKTTPCGAPRQVMSINARVKNQVGSVNKISSKKKSSNVTIKQEPGIATSEMTTSTSGTSTSETSTSTFETLTTHGMTRRRGTRKRKAASFTRVVDSDSEEIESEEEIDKYLKKGKHKQVKYVPQGDSDYSEEEMDAYLMKNRITGKPVKYFPPAGIVPNGCKSSYAESCFTKTRKITETVTNSRGDVMVVRKEVPVRRTIFNPKKNGPGIAAVVVCHPTKPIVKF